MVSLHSLSCEACRADAPQVDPATADKLLAQLPGWQIAQPDGIARLTREFHFADFDQAFAFARCVASIAAQQDHHPSLQIDWGRVVVHWWTHRINGLHLNDFIMAARTDSCATGQAAD